MILEQVSNVDHVFYDIYSNDLSMFLEKDKYM